MDYGNNVSWFCPCQRSNLLIHALKAGDCPQNRHCIHIAFETCLMSTSDAAPRSRFIIALIRSQEQDASMRSVQGPGPLLCCAGVFRCSIAATLVYKTKTSTLGRSLKVRVGGQPVHPLSFVQYIVAITGLLSSTFSRTATVTEHKRRPRTQYSSAKKWLRGGEVR
jgi:DNA-binding PucR family transcriptional regulator